MVNLRALKISPQTLRILVGAVLFSAVLLTLLEYVNVPPFGDDHSRVYGQFRSFGSDFETYIQGQLPDRPVLMIFLWFGFMAHGGDFFWFKFTSLFVHAANAVLLYSLSLYLLNQLGKKVSGFAAILLALAWFGWSVHPMHWVALASIIQVGVPLSLMLSLFALLYGCRYVFENQKVAHLTLFCLILFLGLLTKGVVVLVPLALLPFIVLNPVHHRKSLAYWIAWISTAGLYLFWMSVLDAHFIGEGIPYAIYLAAEAKIFFYNIWRLILPGNFYFLYDPIPFLNPGFPRGVFEGFFLTVGIGAIAFLFGSGRAFAFALAAYFICSVPESIIRLPHLIFDHRQYVPSALFILLFTTLWSLRPGLLRFRREISFGVLALILGIGGVLAQKSVRFVNNINSTENYLNWELGGPVTPFDNNLFAAIQNMRFLPESAYYRGIAKEAADRFAQKYRDSATAAITKSSLELLAMGPGPDLTERSSAPFLAVVNLIVKKSDQMQFEVPIIVYENLSVHPAVRDYRTRRFLLLLAIGKFLSHNREILKAPSTLESESIRNFIGQLMYDFEYFSQEPLKLEEALSMKSSKEAFARLKEEVNLLLPDLPHFAEFCKKNEYLFDAKKTQR